MKYRKKPVVIEAHRWVGVESLQNAPQWLTLAMATNKIKHATVIGNCCLYISTLEGTLEAQPGDYIIKGVKGELYPCKPDIFEMTYERVD